MVDVHMLIIYAAPALRYGAYCRWGNTEVDPTGILLFFLAAVVWHSDWLKEMAAKHPGHLFSMIPILSTLELLWDLKELVTLDPKGNVK